MRRTCQLAIALAIAAPAAALAESATIRIEPRPYYGASVTLEHGVRVWRPLPATKYVVVNPDGRTPLSLNLTDVQEHRTTTNNVYGSDAVPAYGSHAGTYGLPYTYGASGRHHGQTGQHKPGVAGYQPGPRRPMVRHGGGKH